MEHPTKNVRARCQAGLLRISARLAGGVAVIAALAMGANLAATPASATVARHPASSAVRMTEAIAYVRAHDKALAHAPDQKIETLITGMAKKVSKAHPAAHIRADFLGVSKSGHTLWFNKADVVAWAVASTAIVLATLVYMGVELEIAYEYIHLLFDVFWAATFGHRCAWFTYQSPRSLGTYSC